MKSLLEVLLSHPPLETRRGPTPPEQINPETGIKWIKFWGSNCGRGIIPKNMGTTNSGGGSVRKISVGRKKIDGKLWTPGKDS